LFTFEERLISTINLVKGEGLLSLSQKTVRIVWPQNRRERDSGSIQKNQRQKKKREKKKGVRIS